MKLGSVSALSSAYLTRLGLALSALLCGACEGPTLDVGQRLELLGDGGADVTVDAGDDAGGDGGRRGRRDASLADRDPIPYEGHPCLEEYDCMVLNVMRKHCNLMFARCVECFDDRHCKSGDCSVDTGDCVLDDHGSDDTSSGTPGGPGLSP